MNENPNGSEVKDRIEVLCRVREHIRSGDERYICFSLQRVRTFYPALLRACLDVERQIRIGLEGHMSLQTWLVKQLFESTWAVDLPQPYRTAYQHNDGFMHTARLAWLDRLLDHEQRALPN